MHYPVTDALIKSIRHALNVDANKTDDYLEDVAKNLPAGLKMELMMIVYQSQFAQFPFFTKLGNRYFITWVSSMLKPRITTAAQRLYAYGDEIDDFYFMTKGIAAFIREKD